MRVLVFFLFVLFVSPFCSNGAQLSGAYDIDTGAVASASSFRNFTSAIAYLTGTGSRTDGGPANSAPYGVSGPVVFNVSAGVYNESITVTAITGASALNSITFEGGAGNAATRVVSYNVQYAALVTLNQCKYVHFRNLTLNNTTTLQATVFAIVCSGSNNAGTGCSLKNCVLNYTNPMPGMDGYGVCISATTNGVGTLSCRADSIDIDSNIISGGAYGITYSGIYPPYCRRIRIRENTLNLPFNDGILVNGMCMGVEVRGNIITMSPLNTGIQYGMQFANCVTGGNNASILVIGNRVNYSKTVGINFDFCTSTAAYPIKIHNNMVADAKNLGINLTSNSTLANVYEIYHNSIRATGPSGYALGYYNPAPGSAVYFKNNILAVTASSGSACPVYFNSIPATGSANYNVYYNSANANLLNRGGTMYTAANYNTTTAGGDSSFNLLPAFASLTNLHLTNSCGPKGISIPGVALDYDKESRSVPPDIGCDQVARMDDLAMEAILAPLTPAVTGLQDVRVRLKNAGANAINSFNIEYVYNAGTPVYNSWSGSLNACDTMTYIFTGSQQVNILSSSHALKVYTYDPNLGTDGFQGNDTVSSIVSAPLPVTWLNFFGTLHDDVVNLKWQTASEVNNSFFEIERSQTNGQWLTIGKVKGKGNSSTINTYLYQDPISSLSAGNAFICYRLKQVDTDGKSSWSGTVKIALQKNNSGITIYPNPFSEELIISNLNPTADKVCIEIVDLTGRCIFKDFAAFDNAGKAIKIDTRFINESGIYILKINGENCKLLKK